MHLLYIRYFMLYIQWSKVFFKIQININFQFSYVLYIFQWKKYVYMKLVGFNPNYTRIFSVDTGWKHIKPNCIFAIFARKHNLPSIWLGQHLFGFKKKNQLIYKLPSYLCIIRFYQWIAFLYTHTSDLWMNLLYI